MERFRQNDDFIESINTNYHTVNSYKIICRSNEYHLIILPKFAAYHSCCLVITESGTKTDMKNINIQLSAYSSYQWKLKTLVQGKGNGEIIMSTATESLHHDAQAKDFKKITVPLYFLQSVIADNDASGLMSILNGYDRLTLDNSNVKHNFYQDMYWWHMFLVCIDLNGTENSQNFCVWQVYITSSIMKFVFFMNNKSLCFNINIKEQCKWFQTTSSLSSKALTLFLDDKKGNEQSSTSLSSGFQMNFFKRNVLKVIYIKLLTSCHDLSAY